MSSTSSVHSAEHLTKCLLEKDKYKQTQQYIKQVQLQNQKNYQFINEALFNVLATNKYPYTGKLFGLRFFKELFLTSQFQLIDGLHQAIFKQIVKACQYDKASKDKNKRGNDYFQKVQKRKKQGDIEKVSFSYVLFATEIIYVMGRWYSKDENDEVTDYSVIYERLKKSGIPFPVNEKELKFFKPEDKDTFSKNYKQWLQKLPQIDQQEQQEQIADGDKQNKKKEQKVEKQNQVQQKDNLKLPENKNPILQQKPKNGQKMTKNENSPLKNHTQSKSKQSKVSAKQKQDIQANKSIIDLQNASRIAHLLKKEKVDLKIIQDLQQKLVKKAQDEKSSKQLIQKKQAQNKKLEQLVKQLSNNKNKQHDKQNKSKHQFYERRIKQLQQILKNQRMLIQSKSTKQNTQIVDLRKKIIQISKTKHQQIKQTEQKAVKTLELQLNEKQSKLIELTANNQKMSTQIKLLTQKLKIVEASLKQKPAVKTTKQLQNKQKVQQNDNQQLANLQKQIKQMQEQMQKLGQFYSKQMLNLKQQTKTLKSDKESVQKSNIKLSNKLKSVETQLQNQRKKRKSLTIQLNDIKIESQNYKKNKNKIQQAKPQTRQISMSQYLSKTSTPKNINKKLQPNNKGLNFDQNESIVKQQLQQISFSHNHQYISKDLNIENAYDKRSNSMGKTEQSKQKLNRNRNTIYKKKNSLHRSSNSSSQINLFSIPSNSMKNSLYVSTHQSQNQNNCFSKKSSLNLQKRSSEHNTRNSNTNQVFMMNTVSTANNFFSDIMQSTNKPKLYKVLPFIEDYFSIPVQESFLFRNLCLNNQKRKKIPIFTDNLIQVKLLKDKNSSQQLYIVEIMNVSFERLRVRFISGHDQFRIIGDKIQTIQTNSKIHFSMKTKVKDLNLRCPIITLLINQERNILNRSSSHSNFNGANTSIAISKQQQLKYHIPLPLTLLQFSQPSNQIPESFIQGGYNDQIQGNRLTSYKSEVFLLNPKYQSLMNCFQSFNLKFYTNTAKTQADYILNNMEWKGTLEHKFIENIQCLLRMTQYENSRKVCLEFSFKQYDQISECYSKAMIQTLMFLMK